MDSALKHRLIGAAVLSALAIIFLPMLIVGKDPNDTASKVPLKVPAAPAGDFETKELPLAAPASGVPDGGVVGMNTSHPAAASAASPASPAASPGVDDATRHRGRVAGRCIAGFTQVPDNGACRGRVAGCITQVANDSCRAGAGGCRIPSRGADRSDSGR